MNLRPEPANGVSLAGRWRLVEPQREAVLQQLNAELERAHVEQEQKERKHRSGPFAGQPSSAPDTAQVGASGQPGGGAPNNVNNWQLRDRKEQQQALLNAVAPGELLEIKQDRNSLEISQAGSAARRFTMGERSMRVTGYAELQIESGWQGGDFVVHSWDKSQKLDIVERYRVTTPSLTIWVELKMADIKTQRFAATYRLVQQESP